MNVRSKDIFLLFVFRLILTQAIEIEKESVTFSLA